MLMMITIITMTAMTTVDGIQKICIGMGVMMNLYIIIGEHYIFGYSSLNFEKELSLFP